MADVSDKCLKKILLKNERRGGCVYVGYWKSGKLFPQRMEVFGSFRISVQAQRCSMSRWH